MNKNNEKYNLEDSTLVFSCDEYAYVISNLLEQGKIKLNDYLEIRNEYFIKNEYLHLYEKYESFNEFETTWAQSHIHAIAPEIRKPTKKECPGFDSEYDFFYKHKKKHIRIEVKASRAVDAKSDEPLFIKALAWNSKKPFDMNFQQVKPGHCDVFVWVAVWRDVIKYWVFASKEVAINKYYSKGQHRGNEGEGQLHFNRENISSFKKFEAKPKELLEKIIKAYKRQYSK